MSLVMCSKLCISLSLLIASLGLSSTEVSGLKTDLFCTEYPPISRFFRLANWLYLELQSSPGQYILFHLENGSFAPSLVEFNQLMGEKNQHIFSSIISVSTMETDSEDQISELTAADDEVSSESKFQADYGLPFLEKNTSKENVILPGSKSETKQLRRTIASYKNSVESGREMKPLKKAKSKASAWSRSHKRTADRRFTVTTSTANPMRLSPSVPVRIWGYLDTGAFPLEPLYSNREPFPQIGFEDFIFHPSNGSLEYNEQSYYGVDYWPSRRTQFPFDCFIQLPEHGPVAVIHNQHRLEIVRYQLNKPRSYSWRQEPFDVSLKVFYSDAKFDSCVELNTIVALLSDENRLTLVHRDDLATSFRDTSSEVITSVETTLFELLCIKVPGTDLFHEMERMMTQADLEANWASLQQQIAQNLTQFKKPRTSTISTVSSKSGVRVRNLGDQTVSPFSTDNQWLGQTFYVTIAVICAIFVSLVAFVCVLMILYSSNNALANSAMGSGQVAIEAPKVAADCPDIKANGDA